MGSYSCHQHAIVMAGILQLGQSLQCCRAGAESVPVGTQSNAGTGTRSLRLYSRSTSLLAFPVSRTDPVVFFFFFSFIIIIHLFIYI